MTILIPGKLLFLANPRTASHAIAEAMIKQGGIELGKHHARYLQLPKVSPDITAFHVVRNPWDTLVSWWITKRKRTGYSHFQSFLAHFENTYVRRQYLFLHARPPTAPNLVTLKYESLETDLAQLCKQVNIPPLALERINCTDEKTQPWPEYYSTQSIVDAANNRWGEVADRWGYPRLTEPYLGKPSAGPFVPEKPAFLLLQFPKTGCQWRARILRDTFPPRRIPYIQGHNKSNALPNKWYGNVPRIAFIRNPWDWYVSAFFFTASQAKQAGRIYTAPEQEIFKSVKPRISAKAFREALPQLVTWKRNWGTDKYTLTGPHGNMTNMWNWMYEGAEEHGLYIGRFENMVEDLLRIWDEIGFKVPDNTLRAIRRQEPINVSPRRRDFHYYYRTKRERNLVAEADAPLIERFGYSFE